MIISVVKDQNQNQNKKINYQFIHLIDFVENTEHITVIKTISAETVIIIIIIMNPTTG